MDTAFGYFLKAFMLAVFLFSSVFAQELTVSGKVISEESGEGLPGAEIQVKGSFIGTTSDINGNFELKVANAGSATLVINYVGYKSVELPVASSTSNMVIRLEEDVLKGSEVVVTGFASSVKRQNLANSVGTISAEELVPTPAQTLESALNGKIAGITVTQNTGAPGGGFDVNLRGTSTIVGSTQPLYVVDGVLINNAANQSGIDIVSKAAGAGSSTPQGQPTNRIADLNPEDIQSIEVLKGASAAAVYGSKASNGVVIITTKKGTAGRTRISVKQQSGFNSILNKIGTRKFPDTTQVFAKYGHQGVLKFQENPNRFIDYEDVLYGEDGFISETSVSARGGTERTRFYVSGLARTENGIVKNSGYDKFSGRFNLDHRLSQRANVNLAVNYVRSESDRSITGNDNTNTTLGFSNAFTPSFFDIRPTTVNGETVYPAHLFNPSNQIQTRDLLTNNELVNRVLVSGNFKFNLSRGNRHNLDFLAQGGVDFYNQQNRVVSPPELQFEASSQFPGKSLLGETVSTNSNLYLNLVHSLNTASNWLFTTQAGLQFENANLNNSLISAKGITPTQSNIDQAAAVDAFQTRRIQRERGFFVQEEINIQDKVFLTGGLRGDQSSTNGDTGKFFLFPKVAGSLRLSQLDFFSSEFMPELKVRAAFGATGNLPPSFAKFDALIPANIGNRGGVLPGSIKGTPDIEPERTKELEIGIDASLFHGDATLELTFYNQKITNLLLQQDLPISSGFTSQFVNGGEMTTQGFEASLGATVLKGHGFNWTSRVNFSTAESEVDKLTIDPFNQGGFATFLGTFRIEQGFSPTAIIGSDVDANGKTIVLGDANPDFQIGWSNTFNVGNFEISALWDWRQGGDVINLGKLLTDLGGTTADYDDPVTKEGLNLPSNTVVDVSTVSSDRLGDARLELLGTTTAPFIEDGSFLKLREATINYTVPTSTVQGWFGNWVSYLKLGLSGRNLLMITDYSGYDPEVSQFGDVAVGRAVDTLPFPSSRSFYFNVSFGL